MKKERVQIGSHRMESEKDLDKIVNKIFRTEKNRDKPSFSERMADKVAQFGGSWTFIITSIIFFILWIIINSYFLSIAWDRRPYILLNLVLSFLAIFQAPFILMSQNRISDIDRKRDEKEYKLSIKTELELKQINEKLDLLIKAKENGIK
jgi:uncharacterized membrane protein